MKVLLDTHVLVWAATAPEQRLLSVVGAAIRADDNRAAAVPRSWSWPAES